MACKEDPLKNPVTEETLVVEKKSEQAPIIDTTIAQEEQINPTNQIIVEKKKELSIDSLEKKTLDSYIYFCANEELKEKLGTEFPLDLLTGEVDMIDLDPLFEDAAHLLTIHQQGSTSLIQRKFSIGYNRAGRIMDQLEHAGIVGPSEGASARMVLCVDEVDLEMRLSNFRTPVLKEKILKQIKIRYKDAISEKKEELHQTILLEEEKRRQEAIEYEKEQIRRELLEKERIRKLRKQIRKELIESGDIQSAKKREAIPQDIQDKVWIRDAGKCVSCGNNENLEFDHIIPFSKGGSNSYRNIQLLCEKCNRQKSNKIGQ